MQQSSACTLTAFRPAFLVACMTVLFGALAWLSLEFTAWGVAAAAVWLPNAVMLAFLLRGGMRLAFPLIMSILPLNILINIDHGHSLGHSAGFAIANCVEIGLAAGLLRRLGLERLDPSNIQALSRFFLVAVVIAPFGSGVISLTWLDATSSAGRLEFLGKWVLSDACAMLLVVPALLVFHDAIVAYRRPTWRKIVEAALIYAFGIAANIHIFAVARYPLLFLISPVVLLHTFRLGQVGTAVSLVNVAVISVVCTDLGLGPIPKFATSPAEAALLLQAFLAATYSIWFCVSAVLVQRGHYLASLKESEARFRRLADSAPLAIFRVSQAGKLTYVNPAWNRLTGMSFEEALATNWPALRDGSRTTLIAGPHGGTEFRYDQRVREISIRRQDGSLVLGQVEVSSEYDALGASIGAIGVIADVTKERAALAELAERERQYALLASYADDGILRLRHDGVLLYASPSAQNLLHLQQAEWARERSGGGFWILRGIHPGDRAQTLRIWRNLVAGGTDRQLVSYRWRSPRECGAWQWHEASYGAVPSQSSGTGAEVVVSIRDITIRKALEEELRDARNAAEAASSAKSLFLANMSHELRTPMNGVLGFAKLLEQEDLTPTQHHYAELIVDSGRAMMRLLNDILDHSRIDVGRLTVFRESVDIRQTIKAAINILTPNAEAKGMDIISNVPECLPEIIVSDGLRIQQILLNIIGNAVKFSSRSPVAVSAFICPSDPTIFQVDVDDRGIGISPETAEKIFEPFERGDESRFQVVGGAGLGLSISRQLARLLGGDLTFRSRVGIGTTFTLTLPLEIASSAQSSQSANSQSAGNAPQRPDGSRCLEGTRILVAEDHKINQYLVQQMLQSFGCEVELASDGRECLEMVMAAQTSAKPYNLILMDVQMPGLDGVGATRAIRDAGISHETLPIVALTAHAYESQASHILECGMQALLVKPLNSDTLASTLDTVMSKGWPSRCGTDNRRG